MIQIFLDRVFDPAQNILAATPSSSHLSSRCPEETLKSEHFFLFIPPGKKNATSASGIPSASQSPGGILWLGNALMKGHNPKWRDEGHFQFTYNFPVIAMQVYSCTFQLQNKTTEDRMS